MEADREFKHVCKLCNRRFPCGRSLGGHMRSHLIKTQAETGENPKKMNAKRDGNNSAMDEFPGGGVSDGYRLRKNPKKTSRLDEFSDEEKFCRECGKRFQSWKVLFGHTIKCHSTETERVSSNLEFDSQSDDEIEVANRGYMAAAAAETSSSFSYADVSSSVSNQHDQEQEEIALCLMMLSRDVRGFCSTTESSLVPKGNFSKLVKEIPSLLCMEKLKQIHTKMDSGYLKFKGPNLEFSDSIVKINEKLKKNDRYGSNSNNQTEFNPPQFISSKFNSNHKFPKVEFRSNSSKTSLNSETYKIREKKTKFQCNLCNKIFHSYQALGGHRASHKKNKELIDSKTKSSENSIETEISNDPTFESNPDMEIEMENQQESEIQMEYEKKNRNHHQCSICYKIFSSGQALGGHKRSHSVSRLKSRNKLPKTKSIKKSEPEIRDYLDLNLPAPIDDEGSSHLGSIEPWWVSESRSHEPPLVGLI